ncbi:membrane dipeptidase [Sphingobacterium wenxiniae]|uniref:Membrane dipeptidase n=2 Tax=Sphingobacterium wenxiniae TaxID=683125 RepID=A0A1I6UKS8_9SPHI|nr:membrane dipeptidase [Sphingobacterium wenxiniae]
MKRLMKLNRLKTIGIACCIGLTVGNVMAQDYQTFHDSILVVDGHNDVIYSSLLKGKDISKRLSAGHTDLPRLQEGGVDVQVFAVWSDDKKFPKGKAFKHANAQIDALEKMVKANAQTIAIAKSSVDIKKIVAEGKIAAVIGIEGGNMIENSIANLEALYNRGARYLTLTWNYNLPWASAAAIETNKASTARKGLTEEGKVIIRRMNELGMMVDLSHGGEQTFYDVLSVTTKPILVSHSNAYALTPHYRNLKDEQLVALKKNGGVVGVNFYSGFLDKGFDDRVKSLYRKHFGDKGDEKLSGTRKYQALPVRLKRQADAPLERLLEHIDYLVSKVGIDHVAVGSDYDGIESAPQGLEDVSKFPVLTEALLNRGYSSEDVAKIMGLNFLRILKENEN